MGSFSIVRHGTSGYFMIIFRGAPWVLHGNHGNGKNKGEGSSASYHSTMVLYGKPMEIMTIFNEYNSASVPRRPSPLYLEKGGRGAGFGEWGPTRRRRTRHGVDVEQSYSLPQSPENVRPLSCDGIPRRSRNGVGQTKRLLSISISVRATCHTQLLVEKVMSRLRIAPTVFGASPGKPSHDGFVGHVNHNLSRTLKREQAGGSSRHRFRRLSLFERTQPSTSAKLMPNS